MILPEPKLPVKSLKPTLLPWFRGSANVNMKALSRFYAPRILLRQKKLSATWHLFLPNLERWPEPKLKILLPSKSQMPWAMLCLAPHTLGWGLHFRTMGKKQCQTGFIAINGEFDFGPWWISRFLLHIAHVTYKTSGCWFFYSTWTPPKAAIAQKECTLPFWHVAIQSYLGFGFVIECKWPPRITRPNTIHISMTGCRSENTHKITPKYCHYYNFVKLLIDMPSFSVHPPHWSYHNHDFQNSSTQLWLAAPKPKSSPPRFAKEREAWQSASPTAKEIHPTGF